MKLWEKVELSKAVIENAIRRSGRVFASCSFGKDSRVLVDLAMQVDPDLQFIGIDTGYEFPETLEFAGALVKETRMKFRWVKPPEDERKRIEETYGESMVREGRFKCCEMKVPALAPVLKEYDVWITGLRRDENEFRHKTPLFDQGEVLKANAIAFWTREEIWAYIAQKGLSYHPLYDAGYASLGCLPCTSKGSGGERAGRFAGTENEGRECGLHVAQSL